MKKITLLILIACLTIFGKLQAQKIYKAQLKVADYANRPTSMESQVKRSVHSMYANLKEVTVLDFTGSTTNESKGYQVSLQKFLRTEDFFSINNAKSFINLIKENPSVLTLVMPYKNSSLTIDLVASNIFTDDYRICTDKNPAGVPLQNTAVYHGVVRGTNASASISLFNDHVEGFITLDNKTSIEITKIKGSNATNQHVVYNDTDLLVKSSGHYCTLLNPPASQMEKPQTTPGENKTTAGFKCIKNYWETAYSVYQNFGSSDNTNDFVISLFNVYATLYFNENISMKLKTSFIWTSQDPYNDNLDSFSKKRTGYDANTAVLLSNASTGGVAWLNTICQTGDYYRHAYCGSIAKFEQVIPITSYSWPAEVTAHEVGHNLGSPHTHACAWNGNNTAIDGCGPAAGYSEGCNGPIPPNGGSIMSYCHLVSVGINFSKGFGSQPGNLIRSIIRSCITTTCAPIGASCDPPQSVTASAITATTATITWKRVIGAAYYYIYLSSDGGSTYTLVADHLYGKTFNLTGLTKNKNYTCEVWVACGNGSFNSTSINFTTAASLVADANSLISEDNFTIQSNPVSGGHFSVLLNKGYENALIEIFNSNNQLILESRTGSALRNFIAPQTKGLYYVKVTLGDEVISRKFLVQ